MIVLDASALVDLLLRRPAARETAAAIGTERTIHAPHLVDTEVLHVLRRWVTRDWLALPRAEIALRDLAELRLMHHGHRPLRARVWALRERFGAYDATYVALAEALDATLVTSDGRLARGARGFVPVVHAS